MTTFHGGGDQPGLALLSCTAPFYKAKTNINFIFIVRILLYDIILFH